MRAGKPLRVLLVKTSSMGDIVQALPVVHDILEHHPGAHIDWLLEPAYASLVRSHPGVHDVISVAWREGWRKPFSRETRQRWRELRAELARREYDAVIDLQGLCKSALLARLAQGTRYGWKGRACREPAAAWLYQQRMQAPPFDALAAVLRYRRLCAWALGYQPAGEPAYGLRVSPQRPAWLPGDAPFVVLLSATARDEKLWPEAAWSELGRELRARGMALLLAWGSPRERERAQRIAAAIDAAAGAGQGAGAPPVVVAPQQLGLDAWMPVFAASRLVVGVDTGLSFLAAALERPVVGIYTATSPLQVGIQSRAAHRNVGDVGQVPSAQQVLQAALDMLRSEGAEPCLPTPA